MEMNIKYCVWVEWYLVLFCLYNLKQKVVLGGGWKDNCYYCYLRSYFVDQNIDYGNILFNYQSVILINVVLEIVIKYFNSFLCQLIISLFESVS